MNILYMSCCSLLQRESGQYTTNYTNHRYLRGMYIIFNNKSIVLLLSKTSVSLTILLFIFFIFVSLFYFYMYCIYFNIIEKPFILFMILTIKRNKTC